MKISTKIKNIMVMTILVIILLAIVYGMIFFFGGTILSLLGLEYDSLWSLAKFFAIYMIVSIPIDFIVECFFKVLKEIRNLTDIQHNVLYFIIDVPLNMIIIGIIESIMKGISCSMVTALIFSVISCLAGLYLDKKSNE